MSEPTPQPTSPSIASMPFGRLLESLSSKSPAPGGGAAAGMVGATAAAVAGMVVSYSVGRKSLEPHRAFLEDAQARLARARALFLALADEDAQAYGRLNALMRLPEDHPDRVERWDDAVRDAIAPPSATLAASIDLLRLCEALVGKTNPWLNSDLALSAVQAEAAARSAAWNVAVNAPNLPEPSRADLLARARASVEEARERAGRVESGCA